MLGQPISMLVPQVVGFKLSGRLPEGATATDLVLTVTEMLRAEGVVGKFVEFFGHGLAGCRWPTAPRSPTWRPSTARRCGFFPVDAETLRYLRAHRPPTERIALVEALPKEQGLFHDPDARADLLAGRRARPRRRRAEPGRSAPAAGPGAARRGEGGLRGRARRFGVQLANARRRGRRGPSRPAIRRRTSTRGTSPTGDRRVATAAAEPATVPSAWTASASSSPTAPSSSPRSRAARTRRTRRSWSAPACSRRRPSSAA